jgi:hypothetical protein
MEQQAVSLKQCISEITGKQIAMIGKDFIYLDDKTKVESEVINEANILAFKKMKDNKIEMLATTYRTESTKPVPYKDILYKGGDASASAIAGAVELAQSLQETEVKIIDVDDKPNIMTFSEALELSGLIAKAWRTAFFRYKELKVQISNAATVEELDLISWEEV